MISPKINTAGPLTKYNKFKPLPSKLLKTEKTLDKPEKSMLGNRLKIILSTKPTTKNINFNIKERINEITLPPLSKNSPMRTNTRISFSSRRINNVSNVSVFI